MAGRSQGKGPDPPSYGGCLLLGHGSRDPEGKEEFRALVQAFARQVAPCPVEPCVLEYPDERAPSFPQALERCRQKGWRRVTVLPVLLFWANHAKGDVPKLLSQAMALYPDLELRCAEPLGIHPLLLDLVSLRIQELERSLSPRRHRETGVLLVARGSTDPEANADMARIARLVWERHDYPWVEMAFMGLTRPLLPEGLKRCLALGARRVLIIPYFLHTGILVKRIATQSQELARLHPEVEFVVGHHLGNHPLLLTLLQERLGCCP